MNKFKKETLIITAALVIPGGLVALGIWKAYELYKKRKEENDQRTEETRQQSTLDRLGLNPDGSDVSPKSD